MSFGRIAESIIWIIIILTMDYYLLFIFIIYEIWDLYYNGGAFRSHFFFIAKQFNVIVRWWHTGSFLCEQPDRPDELMRIEAAGGRVINWNGQRVLGVLATSRSIGLSEFSSLQIYLFIFGGVQAFRYTTYVGSYY